MLSPYSAFTYPYCNIEPRHDLTGRDHYPGAKFNAKKDSSDDNKNHAITDLRRQATQLVKLVKEGGDVVYITQHGCPTAVLIGYEQYESLLT